MTLCELFMISKGTRSVTLNHFTVDLCIVHRKSWGLCSTASSSCWVRRRRWAEWSWRCRPRESSTRSETSIRCRFMDITVLKNVWTYICSCFASILQHTKCPYFSNLLVFPPEPTFRPRCLVPNQIITFALKMRKVMFWSPCIYLFVCVLLA